jgi:hypothetical protein
MDKVVILANFVVNIISFAVIMRHTAVITGENGVIIDETVAIPGDVSGIINGNVVIPEGNVG